MWECKRQTESRKTVTRGLHPSWWTVDEPSSYAGLFYWVVALGNMKFRYILICKSKGVIKVDR